MRLTEAGRRLLLSAAEELGLDLEPHLAKFARYFDLLTEANLTTNLTAIRDEQGIVLRHFIDSLTCLQYGGLSAELSLIDVGTGAGFPGLPLAIVRQNNLSVDLLDATKKKVDFVESVIGALEIPNARALWGRSEEISQQNVKRETYGAAVTRAVASLQVVAELTLPLVRVGGFVLVQKASGVEAELEPAEGAVRKLGGRLSELISLKLPVTREPRNLVILEKIAPTPPQFPRKPGVPAKNPLS